MLTFEPILSDIVQVFSFEKIKELELRGFAKSVNFNWGADREVSLTDKDTSVKIQWNGTCTSFAIIAAIENRLGGQIHLSERSLWDNYGVYSTKEAIETAMVHFIMEEQYWPEHQPTLDPRFKGKGRYKLSLIEPLESDYSKVLSAIDNGNPCVVALTTPRDLSAGHPQVEATSRIKKRSGHAICVSGYKVEKSKGYFLVKNSWGIRNGNQGYQYIAFELFDHKGYAIFWEIKDVIDRGEQKYSFIIDDALLLEDA